jgi:hypothetical protein
MTAATACRTTRYFSADDAFPTDLDREPAGQRPRVRDRAQLSRRAPQEQWTPDARAAELAAHAERHTPVL